MTKHVCKWIGKALAAGLLAFGLLCLFCFFYYNVPVHYPNHDGVTEYSWEPDRFTSKGTEGFATGHTNNEGFNNLRDYTPGETIDVLLMGSSHMEGFNVARDENAAAVLNTLFGGARRVYSIGTAGHTLLYCVKHLDRALTHYAPEGYVLLETTTLRFSPREMRAVVEGTYPDIPSHTGGLLTLLQKLPFLRLLYTKYVKNAESFGDTDTQPAPPVAFDAQAWEADASALVGKIAEESAAHGVTAIVVYCPGIALRADGRAEADTDPEMLASFSALCEERGVLLLDLTQALSSSVERDQVLPYGFSNTAPGMGHLNRVGHRIFAESVYALICTLEG